jgi:hypothetical protein
MAEVINDFSSFLTSIHKKGYNIEKAISEIDSDKFSISSKNMTDEVTTEVINYFRDFLNMTKEKEDDITIAITTIQSDEFEKDIKNIMSTLEDELEYAESKSLDGNSSETIKCEYYKEINYNMTAEAYMKMSQVGEDGELDYDDESVLVTVSYDVEDGFIEVKEDGCETTQWYWSSNAETYLNDQDESEADMALRLIKLKPVIAGKELVEKVVDNKEVVNTKPVEKKPVEKKPVEKKPVEKKPVEKKPVEKKPVEKKAVEKKPVEKKPVEKKPVEKKPVEKKPVEKKPVEKKPVEGVKVVKKVCIKPIDATEGYNTENNTENKTEISKQNIKIKSVMSDQATMTSIEAAADIVQAFTKFLTLQVENNKTATQILEQWQEEKIQETFTQEIVKDINRVKTVKKKVSDKQVKKQTVKKDINKPKGIRIAYIFFCMKIRASMVEDNPSAKSKELTSMMGAAWKNTGEEERAPFVKMWQDDKVRHSAEMKEYQPPAGEDGDERKVVKKKKVSGPPRAKSGYLFYCSMNRDATVEKLSVDDQKISGKQVITQMGSDWKQLSDDEKSPYNDMFEKDKIRCAEIKKTWVDQEVQVDGEVDEKKSKPKKVTKKEKEKKATGKPKKLDEKEQPDEQPEEEDEEKPEEEDEEQPEDEEKPEEEDEEQPDGEEEGQKELAEFTSQYNDSQRKRYSSRAILNYVKENSVEFAKENPDLNKKEIVDRLKEIWNSTLSDKDKEPHYTDAFKKDRSK